MTLSPRKLSRALILLLTLLSTLATLGFSASVHSGSIDRRLVLSLETRFARPDVRDWSRITGLIVAGGSLNRTMEAVKLARAHPHLRIVLSGPGDAEIEALLKAKSIGRKRIVIERAATNTFENALFSKRLLAPHDGETWLLVTSSYHMPRAIGSFYGVGFKVLPWPVREDYARAEDLAQLARHEWLGLIAYWLRGRTHRLFPDAASVDPLHLPKAQYPATS